MTQMDMSKRPTLREIWKRGSRICDSDSRKVRCALRKDLEFRGFECEQREPRRQARIGRRLERVSPWIVGIRKLDEWHVVRLESGCPWRRLETRDRSRIYSDNVSRAEYLQTDFHR